MAGWSIASLSSYDRNIAIAASTITAMLHVSILLGGCKYVNTKLSTRQLVILYLHPPSNFKFCNRTTLPHHRVMVSAPLQHRHRSITSSHYRLYSKLPIRIRHSCATAWPYWSSQFLTTRTALHSLSLIKQTDLVFDLMNKECYDPLLGLAFVAECLGGMSQCITFIHTYQKWKLLDRL